MTQGLDHEPLVINLSHLELRMKPATCISDTFATMPLTSNILSEVQGTRLTVFVPNTFAFLRFIHFKNDDTKLFGKLQRYVAMQITSTSLLRSLIVILLNSP